MQIHGVFKRVYNQNQTKDTLMGEWWHVVHNIRYIIYVLGDHWQGTKWGKSQTSDQLHVCPSGREYFKWSSAQARAIQVCFKSYFCGKNRDKIPGKLDCVHAQKRFPVLAAIPWAKIKNKVYNNQIAAKKNPGKYKSE